MLQAQITGDRFNGMAGAFHVADARSSIILETAANHKQECDRNRVKMITTSIAPPPGPLGDALKMDAVVMPPLSDTICVAQPKPSSSSQAHATVSRSTSLNCDPSAQHDRTRARRHSAKLRKQSPRFSLRASSWQPSDPSEVVPAPFVSAQLDRQRSSQARPSELHLHRKPDIVPPRRRPRWHQASRLPERRLRRQQLLIATGHGSERSREPSMLLADDKTLASPGQSTLRANDGSCFDLDWGNKLEPLKSGLGPTCAAQQPSSTDAPRRCRRSNNRCQSPPRAGKEPEVGEALPQADSARPPSIRVQDQPAPTRQPSSLKDK